MFLSESEYYIPDVMVVCDPEKIKPDGIHGAPDLVVEILSPTTARYDGGHKMKEALMAEIYYKKFGFRIYIHTEE